MQREYTTIARIRELGITETAVDDATVLAAIRRWSAFIESRTGQFFVPEYEVHRANGKACQLVHREDMVPILALDQVKIDYTKSYPEPTGISRMFGSTIEGYTVPPRARFGPPVVGNEYVLDLSWLALVHDNRLLRATGPYFVSGSQNVLITGWFGWVGNPGAKKIETTLATDLAEDDDVIAVTNAETDYGFIEKGDVVCLVLAAPSGDKPAKILRFIAQAVNYADNEISVDVVLAGPGLPVPAGTKVMVFGGVPTGIVQVCDYLVLKDLTNGGDGSGGGQVGGVVSETTDNYSYQLDQSANQVATQLGLGGITGNAKLDAILLDYSKPPYVGFA